MITIDTIQRCVAITFGVQLFSMISHRRPRRLARPRQVAMYLARRMTTRSFPEIGRSFGNRDHATVMHAVRRIEALIRIDPEFADQVAEARSSIEATPEFITRRQTIGEREYASWM